MNATIYTINTCNFCKSAKDFFTSKNIPFVEKNVEQDKAALDEMLKLSDNFAGVPFTIITKDDGTTVSLKGFTLQEFEHAVSGGMTAPTDLSASPTASNAADAVPMTPNLPTDSMPTDVTPTPVAMAPAPAVEATPAPMDSSMSQPSPASNAVDAAPTTPTVPNSVPEMVSTPEHVSTPESLSPASNAVAESASAPMSPTSLNTPAPTEPNLPNSGTEEDVDKKLDTLLQSLQSKTSESDTKPTEMSQTPTDSSASPTVPNTPTVPTDSLNTPAVGSTPDTNMSNPLYQTAEPASNAVTMEPTPATSNVADNAPTVPNEPNAPIQPSPASNAADAMTPAVETPAPSAGATPSIPDFKPRM